MSGRRARADSPEAQQSQSKKGRRAPSSSQAVEELSQGGHSQKADNLSAEDKQQYVTRMVNYILKKDAQKLCIKRADLVKAANKDGGKTTKLQGGLADRIVIEVKEQLLSVFGFELVQFNSKDNLADVGSSQDLRQEGAGKPDSFALVNKLNVPIDAEEHDDDRDDNEEFRKVSQLAKFLAQPLESNQKPDKIRLPTNFNLALTVMSLVALERFSISESTLWDRLGLLGIKRSEVHGTFGDVEKALKNLVLQNKDNEDAAGGKENFYSLGNRAENEVTRKRILRFVEEVFGEKMTEETRRDLLAPAEEGEEAGGD